MQVSRSFCGILAVNVILSHCSGLSFCEPLFTHFIGSEKNSIVCGIESFLYILLLIIACTCSLRQGNVFRRVSVCAHSIRTGCQARGWPSTERPSCYSEKIQNVGVVGDRAREMKSTVVIFTVCNIVVAR